jgi:sulfonate transport system permease protein
MKQVLAWPARRSAVSVRSYVPTQTFRRLVLPFGLLVLWQLTSAGGLYDRSQLPAPLDVLRAGGELMTTGQLWSHMLTSTIRVGQGFAWGSVLALLLGLAVGLSRYVEDVVAPTVQAFRTIPSLAWVPLLILWLGIDEASKITLVAIGVFFPVYTNLVAGIRQIDRKLVEVGIAYGLRGLALARQVLLPAALPSLFTGLRMGLAQGWLFLVAAELIAASRGLGFLLIDSQNTGRADIIVLSIVLLALLGKSSDWLLQRLELRFLRWTDTYNGQ